MVSMGECGTEVFYSVDPEAKGQYEVKQSSITPLKYFKYFPNQKNNPSGSDPVIYLAFFAFNSSHKKMSRGKKKGTKQNYTML